MIGFKKLLGTLTFLALFVPAMCQENGTESTKKFLPGDFVMEHIQDSYQWHITDIGSKKITIPLPIMLYSKHSGFCFFLSSQLHSGKYGSFHISEKGVYQGKLVESVVGANGATKESRPLDFSISKNVVSLFVISAIMLVVFLTIANRYKKNPDTAPHGIQNLFEPIIIFVRDEIAIPSIGVERYNKFMPLLLTVFFFIWFSNLLGIIPVFPGGANVTGNIAITMVLAVLIFIITTISTNKDYWVEIFNNPEIPWFLKYPIPLMPLVEITSVFTKPIILMIRLFANILAGHMVAIVFFSLIFIFGQMSAVAGYGFSVFTIAFTVFMTLLELLVAFIQAYVFTMLSAIYFGMAKVELRHHNK